MAASKHTELIPRNILFGNPTKTSPRISPDGQHLAYLAPVDNVLNVWVGAVSGNEYAPLTSDTERGIRSYFWAPNNKHILYVQDTGGNENWRLYATNVETHETRDLTPFENVQVQILDQDKHFPDELLIAMNKENPQVHDVYNLNLSTGALTLVAQNPGNIAGWIVDTQFKVRGAMAARADGGMDLLVRNTEQDAWRTLFGWDSDDALTSGALSFTRDGQSLYLQDSRHVNAGRLIKLDLSTNEETVIAEDAQYDVATVMIHPDSYEIQAVAFDRDRVEWLVLDASIQIDFDRISGIHQGDFSVVSRDDADETWLIAFNVDNGPVPYYAYHRKPQSAEFLFDNMPALSDYTLAHTEPVTFSARDGLTIHGYLTRPVGQQTNLPLVLNVHGGPWARDTWGFNPEAQWFANRGYACFEINYRGSTGYGKEFLNAGNKEWGRNMHYDLVDGMQWAIQQGIADPQQVAIYGGSYGGYAALVGATMTPDLFRCAVDIVGPSNLITLIQTTPPYWSTAMAAFKQRVGDPETEAEFLKSRSPLFHVHNIKIPMPHCSGGQRSARETS